MARLFALLAVSDLGVFAVAFLRFSWSEAPEGSRRLIHTEAGLCLRAERHSGSAGDQRSGTSLHRPVAPLLDTPASRPPANVAGR